MLIQSLELKNFRNIAHLCLQPTEGMHLIYGENAQGKTNIMEAIWLFSGCKSFRGAKDKDLIRFGEKKAELALSFADDGYEKTAAIEIENRRAAFLDGMALPSPVKLMGVFSAVVFSPVHLSLIQDGPAARRKFLDTAICQLYPAYAADLAAYHRILHQRNALLKEIGKNAGLSDTLDIWDTRLAQAAQAVAERREAYARQLGEAASEIYGGVSGGEKLEMRYRSSHAAEENFYELLLHSRKKDLLFGSTSIGPHRDDLQVLINGKPARLYGSQGQQRSAALAMKMAESRVLRQVSGTDPVLLLDDVMSELDAKRQAYILNNIQTRQVFITCCDPDTIRRAKVDSRFFIQGGEIRKE